jgi:hypothetical protein
MKNFYMTYGTSKGRDTYGYTLITARCNESGKAYRQCGGGYDMIGATVADALNAEYQSALQRLAMRAGYIKRAGKSLYISKAKKRLYGLTAYYNIDGSLRGVSLDGATGLSNVQTIAKAAALDLSMVWRNGIGRGCGRYIGFTVRDKKGGE